MKNENIGCFMPEFVPAEIQPLVKKFPAIEPVQVIVQRNEQPAGMCSKPFDVRIEFPHPTSPEHLVTVWGTWRKKRKFFAF